MADDPRATVRSLLAASGIAPPEAEVEAMIQAYPAMRAAADALYVEAIARHSPLYLPAEATDATETIDLARSPDSTDSPAPSDAVAPR